MSSLKIGQINYSLSGELEKLSSSILIGYQKKFFSLLQNGTKIGYKNPGETSFSEDKIFFIKDVGVCEAEDEHSFTLQTPKRTFTLKAPDEPTKLLWMRTIVALRKLIIRSRQMKHSKFTKSIQKKKTGPSTVDNTISLSFLNETQGSLQSLKLSEGSLLKSTGMIQKSPEHDFEAKMKDYGQLLKNIPEVFVRNNIFVITLKSKVDNLFTASFTQHTYILFSSKSLYPNSIQPLSPDNLTNLILPQWAQVNKLYRLHLGQNNQILPKLWLEIPKIIDIEEPKEEKTAIKVRTEETVFTFYSQTVEEKQRVKGKFKVAIQNYKQVFINGKLMRKNYDNLLRLFTEHYDQFLLSLKSMLKKLVQQHPSKDVNNELTTFSPPIAISIIDQSIQFIEQFILILSTKKSKSTQQMIAHVMKQLHQEIKIVIKLTWDSSYANMTAVDILKFLNALSAYHLKTKQHITDIQFLAGMKELSKVYVRGAWKNFQDIIMGIVQQQKKSNFFKDQDNQYSQTNAIVDLFKFLHEVFDLASPCWEHRMHLHNVQRLMFRAIDVFVNELKAAVDETLMANSQLIAIANNYFRFSITVDEFYQEKFSTLQQKTKQQWQKVKQSYKQLSNIIIDKLAYDARSVIKKFFLKNSFFKLDIGQLCEIIKQSSQNIEVTQFHPVFIKRFYEKLFTAVREGILSLLQQQVSSKKKKHNVQFLLLKTQISKILQTLQSMTFDLMDLSRMLYNGKSKIDKQLNQVTILLSCEGYNQVVKIIQGASEDIKKVYMKQLFYLNESIINLREDYYMGGQLNKLINYNNNGLEHDRSEIATTTNYIDSNKLSIMRHKRITISKQRELRASFSSYYINGDFESHSSVENVSEDEYEGEMVRLISEGYLMKCKTNKKVWQKEYFRLKNGTLYIYQSQNSQKCQHSIPITDISRILAGTATQSLQFTIEYSSLNRQKELQFKCDNVEIRDRWVESLLLEMKRVRNDEKVKRQRIKLNQKTKNQLIIDYEELMEGKGYFSYTNSKG